MFLILGDISCHFEIDFCGWTSSNNFGISWKRHQGVSSSLITGPIDDADKGNYIIVVFIESHYSI